MKITKMAAGWFFWNSTKAIGTQARGATMRRNWNRGSKARLIPGLRPMVKPRPMPTRAAKV